MRNRQRLERIDIAVKSRRARITGELPLVRADVDPGLHAQFLPLAQQMPGRVAQRALALPGPAKPAPPRTGALHQLSPREHLLPSAPSVDSRLSFGGGVGP